MGNVMEGPRKSEKTAESLDQELARRVKLAATIRAKREQGLTLTREEELFLYEQMEENRQDDNPPYGK